MKFVKKEGNWSIYELGRRECIQNCKPYPTYVCWEEKLGTVNRSIGNLYTTENESSSLQEMIAWCKSH